MKALQKTKAQAYDSLAAHVMVNKIVGQCPEAVEEQVDVFGRPIRVGDRVDATGDVSGGIVVAVHGSVVIFFVDYDEGDFDVGRFTCRHTHELRVIPDARNVVEYVAAVMQARTLGKRSGGAS